MIDVDDEALAAAQAVLGTDTKVATVNAALRMAADMNRRQAAIIAELNRGDQYSVLRDIDTDNGGYRTHGDGESGARVPA